MTHRAGRRGLSATLVFALVATMGVAAAPPALAAEPADEPQVTADPVQRPDAISARITARQLDRRVEVTSLTTESSQTFVNPDGTVTEEHHSGPVRVFDPELGPEGAWRKIDTRLVIDSEGVHPRVAAAEVAFSKGGRAPVVELADSHGRGVRLGWSGMRLPEPEIAGNVATYRQVEPGVDLELEALPSGYAKRIVLTERPDGPVVWRFPIESEELEVVETEEGSVELVDEESGETVVAFDGLWMWGAERDERADEPTRSAEVASRLVTVKGQTVLEVAPDPAFLADPEVTLPITIDPTASLAFAGDTFVQSDIANTSQWSSTELKVGTYNGGSAKARTLVKFSHSAVSGKHVRAASLQLYSFHSWSCSARQVNVRRINAKFDSTTVWSTRPDTSSGYGSASFAKGYSSSCAAGWQAFDVTKAVGQWATGTATNHGLQLQAIDETDNYGWKKFRSAEYNSGSHAPKLTVTYNSYPNTATGRSVEPFAAPITSSLTPTLRATFSDPDGGSGKVQNVIRNSAGTVIVDAFGSTVSSGSKSVFTVPSGKFAHGQTYRWTTRGYDGIDYSKIWPDDAIITVDVQGPTTPSVSSSTHPSQSAEYEATGVALSWTASSDSPAGVAGYAVAFNQSATTNPTGTLQTTRTANVTATKGGTWYFHVRPQDKVGNWGTTARFKVNIAIGSVTQPDADDRTVRRVPLQAAGPSRLTSATFRWRREGATSWVTIPAARLSLATDPNTPLTSTTQPMTDRQTAELLWDVAATAGYLDGPIEVQALFNDGVGSDPVRVWLDSIGVGKDYGIAPLGPGVVNLISGNLNLTEADASISAWFSDLTLTRTFNSRGDLAADDLLFGPGWSSSLSVLEAGAGWQSIDTLDHTSATTPAPLLVLEDLEGASFWFERRSDGTYTPEAAFEDLTLTFATSTYTLTDLDGTVVTFKKQGDRFRPDTVTQFDGQAGQTRYAYATVGGKLRPTQVVAPAPPGVSCTGAATARGCRSLLLGYGSVPAGGGTATRLTAVSLQAWDTTTSAMTTTPLIVYGYDSQGRLDRVTDPRPSPNLSTTYTYRGTSNQVETITPSGLVPWTIVYATDTGTEQGRVQAAERSNLQGGTNRWTMVYNVPRAGAAAPYPMSNGDLEAWGQTGRNLPTDVTAVFPPEGVPASTDPGSLTTASYDRAEVHYLDSNGRTVNQASPGGRISVTEHDLHGNVTRRLTPANRALAMASDDPEAAASDLATERDFDTSGLQLLEERGPKHQIELTSGARAGEQVLARRTTRTSYDEGLPSGMDPVHLPTTEHVGALLDDGSFLDVRTTTTAYDWSLLQPTTVTTDPGGLALVSTTVYDEAGLEAERRQPSEPGGGGPGSLRTIRYTAGAHPTHQSQCGGRPEWHGQTCLLTPAGQPTITGGLPGVMWTHTAGYDRYLQPTQSVESAPTAGGTASRTATTTYDAAGRATTVEIAASEGVSVPTVTRSYDSATGLAIQTTAAGETITRTYDELGRQVSYTDAAGNVATATYDAFGEVVSFSDGKAIQTLSYDTATGYATGVTDSQAGSWTAAVSDYDDDGTLRAWNAPHGLRYVTEFDPAGNPVGQSVTQTEGCTGEHCVWSNEHVTVDIHGQWVAHDRPVAAREYRYDKAGRLVRAEDGGPVCQIREYAFAGTAGRNTNRSSLTITRADEDGVCDPATTSTTGYSYDTADRLLDGTVYDGFGRATTVPAGLTGGHGQLEVGYFVNDLIHTLTQDGTSRTLTLDPAMRFASETDQDGVTTGWRYADDSDAPAWLAHAGGGWTRTVAGLSGDLAATVMSDGTDTTVKGAITDLFGSVIMETERDLATGTVTVAGTQVTDEFGAPLDGGAVQARFGWLGGKQRISPLPSGAILMGVRAYLPQVGRFLQVDPITGGNASDYDYCRGDPVGCYDLDGRYSYRYAKKLYVSSRRTRESIMHAIVNDFSKYFPLGGCGKRLWVGKRCKLTGGNPVKVTRIGSTFFELKSLPGHIEGSGRLITFSIRHMCEKVCGLHLKVYSRGPGKWQVGPLAAANTLFASQMWRVFAANISHHF